jgi:ubiquinone/menaquinone biosynthesis C-methylase UbiE
VRGEARSAAAGRLTASARQETELYGRDPTPGEAKVARQPEAADVAVDPNAVYALGQSGIETDRLRRQAEELRPESEMLLDGCGPLADASVIDVGCGPRGVLDLLAERVSPGGRVVGLDADPALVELATSFVAGLALDNVSVVKGDARDTGFESESFDLVHARMFLITLPDPIGALTEMVRIARPGGWVVGLETDGEAALCYPPLPAFDRLCELFEAAFRRNGADPHIGRRMLDLYRRVGLDDVAVKVAAPLYPPGHSRRTIRADMVRTVRTQILELGLSDEQELDELDHAVRRHLDDPDTIMMPSLIFLACGRKPTTT